MIAVVAQPIDAWVRGDGEEYWKTDTAILLHNVSLAAFAEGLGTCWIAAFDEKKVKEILSLGSDSRVLFLSPLGYSSENKGPIRNRKKLEALVTFL
jgi:nitroreductase